jgi:hypothetical protein
MTSGLDTAHRTAARVTAIRSPYRGVDALGPNPDASDDGRRAAGAAEVALAPVVHLANRTPRPARDGATRRAYAPCIDAQNRVNLGKALRALGWTPDTFLVAAREDDRVVIRAGADSPMLTPVPVDADRRLTLPPLVLAGLDVRPGDQVLASVVVDTGELHLFAAADALQQLTGVLPGAAAPAAAPQTPTAPATQGRSRVKPAWAAADGRGQTRPEHRAGG